MNLDLTHGRRLRGLKGAAVPLLLMFCVVSARALPPRNTAECTAKEVARILSLDEPQGSGKTIPVSARTSTEGGAWLIKSRHGKVPFLRRTDFGETGKMQTDYLFLRKDMFLVKQEAYAYAEPIYANKKVVPRLTKADIFVICKAQAWIPVKSGESLDAEKMQRLRDMQSKIGAPELAGIVFGIE